MKPDGFEQKLQQQSLREIPSEWRGEILAAARSGASAERRQKNLMDGGFLPKAASPGWFVNLLWPHPKAWAGLAAVWILIFAVDFSTRDTTQVVAEKSSPPTPEVVAELRQQQRMLAELIGSSQAREADLPKFFPLPRSERVEILMT